MIEEGSDATMESDELQACAVSALDNYGLAECPLTLLNNLKNASFHVENSSGSANYGSANYALRLSKPGLRSVSEVEAELVWLRHLAVLSNSKVPYPVQTMNGADHFAIRSGSGECRIGVLFEWVEGEFLSEELTERHVTMAGGLLGVLHDAGQQWTPPSGFARPTFDYDRLLGDTLPKEEVLRLGDRSLFRDVEDMARDLFGQLTRGPETFGLIHGDFQNGNYLFDGVGVNVIDFDDFGFGFFAYDVAIALRNLKVIPEYASLAAAFLRGYMNAFPTAIIDESTLSRLMAIRRLSITYWLGSFWQNEKSKEWLPWYVAKTIDELRFHIS